MSRHGSVTGGTLVLPVGIHLRNTRASDPLERHRSKRPRPEAQPFGSLSVVVSSHAYDPDVIN